MNFVGPGLIFFNERCELAFRMSNMERGSWPTEGNRMGFPGLALAHSGTGVLKPDNFLLLERARDLH
jgi:hypothetical protein